MKIVKHFHACQLKQGKSYRFLFYVSSMVIEYFGLVLQQEIMTLRYGSVLHVIKIRMGFQNGTFISMMEAYTALRTLRRFWINVYAGTPDVIHTDTRNNFNLKWFK